MRSEPENHDDDEPEFGLNGEHLRYLASRCAELGVALYRAGERIEDGFYTSPESDDALRFALIEAEDAMERIEAEITLEAVRRNSVSLQPSLN